MSLPSSPTSVSVGRCSLGLPESGGSIIFDDSVARPQTEGGFVTYGQLSDDGSMMYGVNGYLLGSPMSSWSITPQGYVFDANGTTFGSQAGLTLSCQHAFCLTGSGYLASTSTLQLVTPQQFGDFASDGLALMNLDNNRMFLAVSHGIGVNGTVVNGTDINWYDATTYKLVAQYVIPNWTSAYAFQKVVGDQLAIANGSELILLPIAMPQPQ